jgi:hypothetical protein
MLRFYVWCRWVRLTTRRYGFIAMMVPCVGPRAKHASVGRAVRDTQWDRAHGRSTGYQLRAYDLVRALQMERALA